MSKQARSRSAFFEARRTHPSKMVCRVCGRPRDTSHDDEKCTEDWIRKCDEEATSPTEGARP